MRFAIDDRFVLSLPSAGYIDVMLLRQSVIPTAVPSRQQVGIFLESTCQLGAGQSLDIEETLRVRIGLQFHLRVRAGNKAGHDGCRSEHEQSHSSPPFGFETGLKLASCGVAVQHSTAPASIPLLILKARWTRLKLPMLCNLWVGNWTLVPLAPSSMAFDAKVLPLRPIVGA